MVDFIPGRLKLKGDKGAGVDKKKKKKKTPKPEAQTDAAGNEGMEQAALANEDVLQGDKDTEEGASVLKGPTARPESADAEESLTKDDMRQINAFSHLTPAEQEFQRRKLEREKERKKREKPKTHKEKVEEYNKKLASQTDHYDMPKIGPG